jgi:hypothetical protein
VVVRHAGSPCKRGEAVDLDPVKTPLSNMKKAPTAAYLFWGVALLYLALSPGTVAGMGYTPEEVRAGSQLMSNAAALMKGNPLSPIDWPRHGPLGVLFDLPFLWLGAHLKGHLNQDWAASLEPVFFTALLVTMLFVWLRRLTSPGWSFLLALVAGFCTMLWPYAYVGLEVKQSLALLLAGYLGLMDDRKATWLRAILFALVCALAVSVKASGTFLVPAILFLIGCYYWRQSFQGLRGLIPKFLVTVAIITIIYFLNSVLRSLFYLGNGGQGQYLKIWLVSGPTEFLLQVVGYFGSPSKGLIVYAPVLLLSFFAFSRFLKEHRALAIFVLLVLGGLVTGHSLPRFYTDETWGPRYLHTAVAPLMLCLGATRERFRLRTAAPVLVLAALGFWVSFLGAFFWYGVQQQAALAVSQSTLETLQGDVVWNPILLDERLFPYYLHGGQRFWTPSHIWWFAKPPDAPAVRDVDLAQYATPQSFLLRFWRVPLHGGLRRLWVFYLACLPVGLLLLVRAGWEQARVEAYGLENG